MTETEEDIALDARRSLVYYTTRKDCAQGERECRNELGGWDYAEWYYTLFSKVCLDIQKSAERGAQMVPDKVLLEIGQLALAHVKDTLEKHAERNT